MLLRARFAAMSRVARAGARDERHEPRRLRRRSRLRDRRHRERARRSGHRNDDCPAPCRHRSAPRVDVDDDRRPYAVKWIQIGVPSGSFCTSFGDVGVPQSHAAVGRAARDQPGLVGAVDADDAAAGPLRQARVRARADRPRPVERVAAQVVDLLADVEAPERRRRPRRADADARAPDHPAVAPQDGAQAPAVDLQRGADACATRRAGGAGPSPSCRWDASEAGSAPRASRRSRRGRAARRTARASPSSVSRRSRWTRGAAGSGRLRAQPSPAG